MLYAGLSVPEVIGMMVRDIDLANRSIMLLDRRDQAYHRMTRRVEIVEPLAEVLSEWLPRVRSEWAFPRSDRARRQFKADRPTSNKVIIRDLRTIVRAADVPGFTFRALKKFHRRHGPEALTALALQVGDVETDHSHWAAEWIRLGERDDPPIVLGREAAYRLTDKQADVIQTLIDAGPTGLTETALMVRSCCGGARKIFNRLRLERPDLGSVLHPPDGEGGYRIGPPHQKTNGS